MQLFSSCTCMTVQQQSGKGEVLHLKLMIYIAPRFMWNEWHNFYLYLSKTHTKLCKSVCMLITERIPWILNPYFRMDYWRISDCPHCTHNYRPQISKLTHRLYSMVWVSCYEFVFDKTACSNWTSYIKFLK